MGGAVLGRKKLRTFGAGLGLAVLAGPLVAESQSFADWTVECEEARCVAGQTLSAPDQTWLGTLQLLPGEEGTVLVMRLPLGVHLGSGLFISDGRTTLYPATFTTCEAEGCRAVLPMSEEMVAGWRAGQSAEIRYRPASDTGVLAFEASLLGVTRALAALEETQ
ncbi:MAG: invasion associated locus B family protein [Pseudomonadota bacterium]